MITKTCFSKNIGSGYSSNTWLAYERHNGSVSDIVVRKSWYANYDAEIVITNNLQTHQYKSCYKRQYDSLAVKCRRQLGSVLLINTGDNNWSDPVLARSQL
ncbi:MAG: hypothetical protein R3A12_19745 [Ignavibacteria bacterium]